MKSLVFLLLLVSLVCAAVFVALVVTQRRLDKERKKASDEAFDRRPVRTCRIINETHGKHRWWSKVPRRGLGWNWIEYNEHECPGVTYTLEHDMTMRLRNSLYQQFSRHISFGEGRRIKGMTPSGPDGLITLVNDQEEPDPTDAFCGSNLPHQAHWPVVDKQEFYCDGNMDDDDERNW